MLKIRDHVLLGCDGKAESEKIPEGVRRIAPEAFLGCNHLREVYIPDSVEEIGTAAFRWCRSLRKVRLPEGLKRLPEECFHWCESLEEIRLPEGLQEISDRAFSDCISLQGPVLPGKLRWIGMSAFYRCQAMTSLRIPEGVREIGMNAFAECKSLREMQLPPRLKYLADWTFCGCAQLEYVSIPKTTLTLGSNAFAQCGSLLEIRGGERLVVLGDRAFYQCVRLTEVPIQDRVTLIGDQCFMECRRLRRVTLPAGLKKIGTQAFAECEMLQPVFIPGRIPFGFTGELFGNENGPEEVSGRGSAAGYPEIGRPAIRQDENGRSELGQAENGRPAIGRGAFGRGQTVEWSIMPEPAPLSLKEKLAAAFTGKNQPAAAFSGAASSGRITIHLRGRWGERGAEAALDAFYKNPTEENFLAMHCLAYQAPIALAFLTRWPAGEKAQGDGRKPGDAGIYRKWIEEHAAEAVRFWTETDDGVAVMRVLEAGFVRSGDMDGLIDYAIQTKRLEIQAMLMEYKHRQKDAGPGSDQNREESSGAKHSPADEVELMFRL